MKKPLSTLALTIVSLAALVVGIGSSNGVTAQEASPAVGTSGTSVVLRDVNNADVGTATFSEGEDGVVTIIVQVQGMPAGEHGIHVHEYGVCDPSGEEPFSSAGSHYNPSAARHGGPPVDDAHMAEMSGTPEVSMAATPDVATAHSGDLGNITVGEDGNGTLTISTNRFTLSEGPMSLTDADGSAILIHANEDDLVTDPSGNSGARIACGVIVESTMAGTPVSS